MGKNKLERFEEMKGFDHVVQPSFNEVFNTDYSLKGKWNKDFFKKNQPITLELGCGKGEYTVGLAERYPDRNFLGVDIKGARIWRGAKQAAERNLSNVGFLRTRIELINSFFAKDEISEIWITFPDPQLKKRRNKKRLTGSRFLNAYKKFLKPEGIVHLKTDNLVLYEYTSELVKYNNLKVLASTDNLYNSEFADDILGIKTFYEQQFLDQGLSITYIKFQLLNSKAIEEPPTE